MAENTKVSPEAAAKNAEAIMDFWLHGCRSLDKLHRLRRKDPDAVHYGRKGETYKSEAERMRVNVDTAAKMRRVAEEYTQEQIEALCAEVKQRQTRFSSTQLQILLRVADRARRDALMRKAVRQSWSCARLERAAQVERGGPRPRVGRKPKLPKDPLELLVELQLLAEQWCRWCDLALGLLPGALHSPVVAATKAVRTVQEAVADQQGRGQAAKKRRMARA